MIPKTNTERREHITALYFRRLLGAVYRLVAAMIGLSCGSANGMAFLAGDDPPFEAGIVTDGDTRPAFGFPCNSTSILYSSSSRGRGAVHLCLVRSGAPGCAASVEEMVFIEIHLDAARVYL
jgi:hypothetical protein